MTHAEARELLELAAAEPGGLDRLGAGDTTESIALAGHLAGCDPCREEYGRLRRASALLRRSLAEAPPADLRERTLAFVAAVGRSPGGAAADAAASAARETQRAESHASGTHAPETVAAPSIAPAAANRGGVERRLVLGWVASLAAAIVVSVALTGLLVAAPQAAEAERQRDAVVAIARVTGATMAVDARPDARHVALAPTVGGAATGAIAFSASSRQVVVVSQDLPEAPTGSEYRCWIESGGARTAIGRMYFAGGLAYWAGTSDALGAPAAGTTFGVSLVSVATGGPGEPVMTGTLQAQ